MRKKITLFCLSGLIIANILAALDVLAQSRISYIAPTSRLEKPKASKMSTSRGCSHHLTDLVELLAPSGHIGLTVSARPTLLFKLKKKSPVPAKIVVATVDATEALFERQIAVGEPGVKRISLPSGIELDPNQEYLWSVVFICNEIYPSNNFVVQASIKRIAQEPALTTKLGKVTSTQERAKILAINGIWYDAIAQVQNNPLLLQELMNQKEGAKQVNNAINIKRETE